jgi:hypothetical protein
LESQIIQTFWSSKTKGPEQGRYNWLWSHRLEGGEL